ncbi:Hypothetical_protein [Hexamita inflata]|uniref:Hypothetical_protein n=1 Tax=Hexamita inflata TaxID=28002 RepID=A0AA86QVY4_9EUKA|nr:Hypothetical protein HINF_LOCUS46165 [Hexamita inflata]
MQNLTWYLWLFLFVYFSFLSCKVRSFVMIGMVIVCYPSQGYCWYCQICNCLGNFVYQVSYLGCVSIEVYLFVSQDSIFVYSLIFYVLHDSFVVWQFIGRTQLLQNLVLVCVSLCSNHQCC